MTAPTLPPLQDEGMVPSRPPRAHAVGIAAARMRTSVVTRTGGLRPHLRSPWLVGPLAAIWAAGIGFAVAFVPLLLVWMATPTSGLTWLESLRLSGLLWAVAQGTPIAIGAVTYSLLPWGLAVIPVLLLAYAGGWAARAVRAASLRHVLVLTLTASACYAVLVAIVAQATTRLDSGVSAVDASVHALVLSVVAFGIGATRSSTLRLSNRLPAWSLVMLRAGLIGAMSLLAIGAVAATVALVVRVDDAVTMAQSLNAGLGGGLALLALGVAYVPVVVVWATAYVVGAGVMIGPAIVVSPFVAATAPTQLPPFPLLVALPQSATPMAWALPLAGVLAGVLAGLAIGRGARAESRLLRLVMALGAAAVSAVVMLVLAYLATGSLGDLRLASLGPSPTTVAVLVFVLVTLGAVPSAVVTSPPQQPRLAMAEPTADDASHEGESPDV